MRICLHTVREIRDDFVGGTERLLVELAKELEVLGHDPFIVCTGGRGHTKVENIPVQHVLPETYRDSYLAYGFGNSDFLTNAVMGGVANEVGFRALGRYAQQQLQNVNADVFHLNSFAVALFCAATRNSVVTNHENEREYDSKWGEGCTNQMANLVAKRKTILHKAHALCTPSQYYANQYSKVFRLKVSPVKAGISLNTFKPTVAKHRRGKEKIDNLRVLLPSRFDPTQKGHSVALEACKILKNKGLNVDFIFSGIREDYRDRTTEFITEAREHDVAERILLKNYVNIVDGYHECDVVISPERYCSYGLSISEALALGVPTVLTDIPTHREIANNCRHALFFQVDDSAQLAELILAASEVSNTWEDAIRFRIDNDLRLMAIEYNKIYLEITRNKISS